VGTHEVAKNKGTISLVTKEAFDLILENPEQFNDGLHFGNLPNGFGLEEVWFEKRDLPLLYYKKSLLKSIDSRTDTLLAPQIFPTFAREGNRGTVGQFYPFLEEYIPEAYEAFSKKYEADFTVLYSPLPQTLKEERIKALVKLIELDLLQPTIQEELQPFISTLKLKDKEINYLAALLLQKGASYIVSFLKLLSQLDSEDLQFFMQRFILSHPSWDTIFTRVAGHKEELTALEALEYLVHMPDVEKEWWNVLSREHVEKNDKNDFRDLLNAHRYFFQQLKNFDPPI
jgi:hypothetical protein